MAEGPAGDGPRTLAALAVEVAHEAGALVERHAGRVGVAATKSSDVDVVTEADHASEDLIRTRLSAARPHDSFLGEEGEDVVGSSGVRWVIDPIDGTVNFLYGLPEYAVSIAAEVDGDVVAGVVHNPARGQTYVAHVGPGSGGGTATRNGTALRVRADVPLAERLVATGFGYERDVRAAQAATTARLLPEVRDIRRHGSCALELCHLAEGSLDGYVEEGVNLWDHAAGALIARLAGARVELLRGAGGRALVLAAPEPGFEAFLDAVRTAGFVGE